jgi:hypothetical protein
VKANVVATRQSITWYALHHREDVETVARLTHSLRQSGQGLLGVERISMICKSLIARYLDSVVRSSRSGGGHGDCRASIGPGDFDRHRIWRPVSV